MKSQKMAQAGIGDYGHRTGGCQTPKCLAHIQRTRTVFPLKCARQMLTSSLCAVRIPPWLCQTVRQLVARLEQLEAVAEAAREFYDAIYNEKNAYETWPDIMERQEVYEAGNRLREALAALEEVEG